MRRRLGGVLVLALAMALAACPLGALSMPWQSSGRPVPPSDECSAIRSPGAPCATITFEDAPAAAHAADSIPAWVP